MGKEKLSLRFWVKKIDIIEGARTFTCFCGPLASAISHFENIQHLHLIFTFTGETFSTDLDHSLNDVEVDRQGASLSYPSANGYYDNYYNNYYKTDQGMPSSSFHSWLIKSWKKVSNLQNHMLGNFVQT